MTALLLTLLLVGPQEGKKDAPPEDKRPIVELSFATEHVPDKLQEGEKVHIKMVMAVSINKKGEPAMSLREFVRDAEVVFVETVKEPKQPWEAVFVKFRVTPDQAEMIRKIKKVEVTVQDSDKKQTSKRPVPLHVERAKK